MKARLQPWLVAAILALVAIAAWFQASAVTAWLDGRLALDASALAGEPSPARAGLVSRAPLPAWHTTRADEIVERNPFDSVTGPLNRPAASAEPEQAAPLLESPYEAPECTADTKVAVIAAADPLTSVVALSSQQTGGATRLYRMGDPVGDKRVWYIVWDRVWLRNGAELCQAKLFRKASSGGKPVAVAQPPPKPPKPGAYAVPAEIKSKIQRVSATEFNVDRSVIDTILENQATLMRSARIAPERENGKTVGIRLLRVAPDSLLGTIGLENGDRLETINGFDITSPEKALEAYARLRTAGTITVAVNRKGKPVTIEYRIR